MSHDVARSTAPPVHAGRALLATVLLAGCGGGNDAPRDPAADGGDRAGAAPADTGDADPSGAWLVDATEASGVAFTHASGFDGRWLMPEIMCGGAVLFDMDGDGDLDLYLVQAGGAVDADPASRAPNRLFRNRGDGTFEDVTEASGAGDRGYGIGATAGDADGDGDVDLYVANVGRDVLLRNRGDGTFEDATDELGLGDDGFASAAAFVDHDADGDLDLWVLRYLRWSPATEIECRAVDGGLNYCSPEAYQASAIDLVYRNDRAAGFVDVTAEIGVNAAYGNGLGIVADDFDGDGAVDVFVANDLNPNQLWTTSNGGSSVRDEAFPLGVAVDGQGDVKSGMGVDEADIDRDGDPDLLVVNLKGQTDSLFRNDGGFFVDVTAISGLGLASKPFTRFGTFLRDLDHDGHLDYFAANGEVTRPIPPNEAADPFGQTNLLLAGGPGPRFRALATADGTAAPRVETSRGAAVGDLDGDGDLDLVVVNKDGPARVFRNVAADRTEGGWILLDVRDRAGAPALGAVVTARVVVPEGGDAGAGSSVRAVCRAAASYASAHDPRIHLGLADGTALRDVIVRWPDGTERRLDRLEARRTHRIDPPRPGAG